MDLSLPYLELVEKITTLSAGEKELGISQLWDHFIPLCEEVGAVLKQKKASNHKKRNIFNVLYSLVGPIPWLIETFGNSPGSLQMTQPTTNRLLFRFLTKYGEDIPHSLMTSLKSIHKYFLLLKQLYGIPFYRPDPSDAMRKRMKKDLFFQMYPQQIDVYLDMQKRLEAEMEEENPSYHAYLSQL